MNDGITLPSYSPELFVNRETQVDFVKDKIEAIAQRRSIDKRTVIIVGEHGTGKTWLMAHICHQLSLKSGISFFSINLAPDAYNIFPFSFNLDTAVAESPPEIIIRKILESLAATFEIGDLPDTSLSDATRLLTQQLKPFLKERPLILLVNSVYEAGDDFLRPFENYLLDPLAVEPNVLIVMTGRGIRFSWVAPELKLSAEFLTLQPFESLNHTIEQLERHNLNTTSQGTKIHYLSGGNPKANYLLGYYKNPATALDQTIAGMLEPVPHEQHRQIRDYLEALAIPNFFDSTRVPIFLKAYDEQTYSSLTVSQVREVLDSLLKPGFAEYDTEEGGYYIYESTRGLILRYLMQSRPEQYKGLQQTAITLYQSWAKKYHRNRERWQKEVDYHLLQLELLEKELDDQ